MSKQPQQTRQQADTQVLDREEDLGALLDIAIERTAAKVDKLSRGYADAIEKAPGDVQRAMLMARAMNRLRESISPGMMAEVINLMNSPNGFMTDRGPHMKAQEKQTTYSPSVVKECLIEALLNGFNICGNEWNILAGRFYGTLNGWKRKFEDIQGISDINEVPGVPRVIDGQTIVRVALSWALDGKKNMLADHEGKPGRAFPIIVSGYSPADQTIGKARRKAYKAAYEKATGSKCLAEDGAVGEDAQGQNNAAANTSRTVEMAARLGAAPSNGNGAATPEQSGKITLLLEKLMFSATDFGQFCEQLEVPSSAQTQSHAAKVLAKLEEMNAQMERESREEANAIQG